MAKTNKVKFQQLESELLSSVKKYLSENYDENCITLREIEAFPLPISIALGVDEILDAELDAGFSETILHLIDSSGFKDSEIYHRAGIDRKLFSKIRSNKNYRPSKSTAIALAIALELDLDAACDLLSRAGYALSHSIRRDIAIEYFIKNKIYDIKKINFVLYELGEDTLS